jgi:hypothetical protein
MSKNSEETNFGAERRDSGEGKFCLLVALLQIAR